MKKPTFLSLALLCSSFSHQLCAQEVNLDEDTKLKKYHQVLIKRPESTNLFEKFYSNWLDEIGKKELALSFMPKELPAKMNKKQTYNKLIASIKKKKGNK